MKFVSGLMLLIAVVLFGLNIPIGSAKISTQPHDRQFNNITPDLSEGLIDQWSFNEESGLSIIDSSNDGSLGTLYGPTRTAGPMGQALEFDGVDDYVQIGENGSAPAHLNSVGDGTLSIWFKLNELPDEDGISPLFYYGGFNACSDATDAANGGFVVEVGHGRVGSHRIYFTSFADGCEYPSFCVDSRYRLLENQWYQFTVVVEEKYNTLYLNGEELTDRHYNFGSEKSSEFFADAVSDDLIWLGKGYWNSELQYLNGALDEIRIYDRPLTATEILDLYNLADIEYRNYETKYDTTFKFPEKQNLLILSDANLDSKINYLPIFLGILIIITSFKFYNMKKK